MINLEQVRQLEDRIKKAIALIKTLRLENEEFKQRTDALEAERDKLRDEAEARQVEEKKLEAGLQDCLDILDEVDETTSVTPA